MYWKKEKWAYNLRKKKLLLRSSFLPSFMDFAQPRVDFCFIIACVGIIDINVFVLYRNTQKYEHNRNISIYPISFKTNKTKQSKDL